MKPLALGLAVAVLVPVSARAVTPGGTYNFCGGSGFSFCASVNLSVTANAGGGYKVTMVVVNQTVGVGSTAPGQFVAIGLDNVLPPGEKLATPSNFKFQQGTWNGTGYDWSNVCGSNPICWNMATNQKEGGGVKVDFDANTTFGDNVALSSNCSGREAHYGFLPINTCGEGSDPAAWKPVQISFDVTQAISSADIYVMAVGATGTTQCSTGGSGTGACKMALVSPIAVTPPVTAVPEPATITLLAGGMAALSGFARIRRRRNAGAPPPNA
jgi:hypothetical protein